MNLFLKERFELSIRGCPASKLIRLFKKSERFELGLSLPQLEAHFLCGGDPWGVVEQLVEAQTSGIELEWDQACAIDLATMNKEDSLQQAIESAKTTTRDQFELELSCSGKKSWILEVTVSHKVNLARYVGGADFPVLKERINKRIEEFHETKKDTIVSNYPIHDLKLYVVKKSPNVGTKLTLDDIVIRN